MTSPDYNAEAFQSELFPLHSPLLRESWLVSFPPLSYMLKFSGYSCLIGGPIERSPLHFCLNSDARPLGFFTSRRFLRFSVRKNGPNELKGWGLCRSSHRWPRRSSRRTWDFLREICKKPSPTTHQKWGCGGDEQTLQQTYFPKEVQVAFKVLMTHWILQFA